jgi:hypothetical protein
MALIDPVSVHGLATTGPKAPGRLHHYLAGDRWLVMLRGQMPRGACRPPMIPPPCRTPHGGARRRGGSDTGSGWHEALRRKRLRRAGHPVRPAAARTKLVEGAVSMVEMALNQLSEKKVVELDDKRRAAMVSNLMVVLCGEQDAQPVVNAGSLY